MLDAIRQIRSQIDISIGEAKELLHQCNGDIEAAQKAAFRKAIEPIIAQTGATEMQAREAFLHNRQDVLRAIEHLRFELDRVAYDEARKPTTSETRTKILEAEDVFDLMSYCFIEPVFEHPHMDLMSAPIKALMYQYCFYSLYLTDDSALFEASPIQQSALVNALRDTGSLDLAERFSKDLEAGMTLDANFQYLVQQQDSYMTRIRDFCLLHIDAVFQWRNKEFLRA
jgi:hypothetical protein